MNTGQYSFDSLERSLSTSPSWDTSRNTLVLTFASITETLKAHENSIKELELLISNKPSRHEVKSDLSEKVSVCDLQEKLVHNNAFLQAKLIELEDRPCVSEVQKMFVEYLKTEDAKKLIETKISSKEMNTELNAVYTQIDKVYQDICESLAKIPNTKDLEFYMQELKSKPSVQQLEELEKKLEGLGKVLKSKVDKGELVKKADTQDFKSLLSVLESKVGVEVFEKFQNKLERLEKNEAAFKKKIEKIVEEGKLAAFEQLENKIGKHSSEYSRHLMDLNRELKHIQEHPISHSGELNFLKEKLNENVSFFYEEIDGIKESLKNITYSYKNELSIEKANLRDVAAETVAMQGKSFDQDLKILKSDHTNFAHTLIKLKENFDQLSSHISQKFKELNNNYHSNLSDLKSLNSEIQKKADNFEIENLIHEKNRKIVSSLIEIKEDIQQRLNSIQSESFKKSQEFFLKSLEDQGFDRAFNSKADKKDLELIIKEIKQIQNCLEVTQREFAYEQDQRIASLQQDFTERFTSVIIEVRDKMWTSDMVKLIDSKASISEVNNILLQLHSEIDEKLSSEAFTQFTAENSVVLNTLCAEICIGRWLWKSGNLRDRMVVWDEENTNTNPLLFVWEDGRNYLLIEEAGIFELNFAVFCAGKVEVLVNTSRVLACEGGEAGCSKSKFLVLPSKSRVSLKFWSSGGQGFISLKKL